jgi:hypothetical protein
VKRFSSPAQMIESRSWKIGFFINRLLKKSQSAAVRYTRRTARYASFLAISRALHLCLFEQPG